MVLYCNYDYFQLEPGHSITSTIVLRPNQAGLITNKFVVVSWGDSGGETLEKIVSTQVSPVSTPWASINLQNVIYWAVPPGTICNLSSLQIIGCRITWCLLGGGVIDGVITSVKGNFVELRDVKIYSLPASNRSYRK